MTGRDYLLEVSAAVAATRELRYQSDELFDDLDEESLTIVARGLRAVSYSAEVGARKMEALIVKRAAREAGASAS